MIVSNSNNLKIFGLNYQQNTEFDDLVDGHQIKDIVLLLLQDLYLKNSQKNLSPIES